MNVLVVGANGKVARNLVNILSEHSNHHVTAMLRKEEQVSDLSKLGADNTVIADLEGDISHAFEGIDAVVFAAGSGPQTGADKTVLIDLWGARKTIDETKKHNIKRFVMISSIRSEDPESGPVQMRHYLVAKKLADEYLLNSGLDYTIVRPGPLSNDEPVGTVHIAERVEDLSASVSRADVADVVAHIIDDKNTYSESFDLLGGSTPIEQAIKNI
ncbi:SDR family oxidoreductase [Salibacterium salarium]|uniref:SDR family oxidoreductase n=1 Tax=Salibacterium salarium TaxID=284579 RepID=A0A428N1K0_9BACI|nr:SDR family oxidoreductase [Salibacterium salarium]RSL32303.1 SDR family oxidoreductase [Salibacterium salarium]